jgi:catechol 2,3-dioxygenase-like lactoylglutathione lyase family enzyme
MKPKIGIITLGVPDVKRSAAFYEALGFRILSGDGDDFVVFDTEGTKLALFPKVKLAEDAHAGKVAEGFSGITLAHNEPSKEAVREVMAEAKAAGASITKEPQDTFWGGFSGYFRDPDGYLWEIAWNPFLDVT